MKRTICSLAREPLAARYVLLAGLVLGLASAEATERLFTYTYEPETMPQGAIEAEQWVSWRAGRNTTVRQNDYHRLQFREELEYGVTDNYTVALYLNSDYRHVNDPAGLKDVSHFRWAGLSLENKYLVLNPAERPIGLALYLEPTYDGENAELEQKIILGQRHGDWKWALNLVHATEWENDFREKEGELEFDLGLARVLSPRWALGIELRGHSHLPDYDAFEDFALYAGPVLSYRCDKWWAALTIMPQVFGDNYGGDPDGNSRLDLAGHEQWNIRFIVGHHF